MKMIYFVLSDKNKFILLIQSYLKFFLVVINHVLIVKFCKIKVFCIIVELIKFKLV